MKVAMVLAWAVATQSGIDFRVNQKTYQISQYGKGFWERLFPEGDHPYRKDVSETEIQDAFDNVTEFIDYKNGKAVIVTRQELEDAVSNFRKL